MRLSTLAMAAVALVTACGASAQPIQVVSTPTTPRSGAPAASACVPGAPGVQGADIECVLSLTPPKRGAEPPAPSRILIRTQWAAAKRCAGREAQVVDLATTRTRAAALPVIEQATPGRACAS